MNSEYSLIVHLNKKDLIYTHTISTHTHTINTHTHLEGRERNLTFIDNGGPVEFISFFNISYALKPLPRLRVPQRACGRHAVLRSIDYTG